MKINLTRKSGTFHFEAVNEGGATVDLDANPSIGGTGKGFRPMEMLLNGLGGCSGIDVVNLLNKQKQPLSDIRISIDGERKDEIPSLFSIINIHFDLYGNLNEQKVHRVMELTFQKYCSVALTLSATATINHTFTIHPSS